MKALTIKQPWVHAILHEGKDVENRSWNTTHRGWIAIHVSARPSRDAEYPRGVRMPELGDLQYSAIVAVVKLVDVKASARSKWFYRPGRGEKNLAWMLGTVRRLRQPIEMKGTLRLWKVPAYAVKRIRAQLPGLNLE